MGRKKEMKENEYDFLETMFGATPGEIMKAIEQVGPYKARLITYFQVQQFTKNKQKNDGRTTSDGEPR